MVLKAEKSGSVATSSSKRPPLPLAPFRPPSPSPASSQPARSPHLSARARSPFLRRLPRARIRRPLRPRPPPHCRYRWPVRRCRRATRVATSKKATDRPAASTTVFAPSVRSADVAVSLSCPEGRIASVSNIDLCARQRPFCSKRVYRRERTVRRSGREIKGAACGQALAGAWLAADTRNIQVRGIVRQYRYCLSRGR